MSNYASNENMEALMTAIGNKKDDKPISMSWSDYIALTTEERAGKHFVLSGAPSIDPVDDKVEVTADGVKTNSQLLDELYALVDNNKITVSSYISRGDARFKFSRVVSGYYSFFETYGSTSTDIVDYLNLKSNGSTLSYFQNGTSTDVSSNVPASGTKFTLYYGNKIALIDMQVDADNVPYDNTSSGLSATDAQGAIDEINAKTRKFDSWEAISNTSSWSASTDGFLYVNINPDSSAGGRLSFQINGNSYYVNSTSGSQQSLIVPVIKGGTISSLAVFTSTATFKFMPVR